MAERAPSIRVLDPAVARKIAAGEVIERPGGVVRELLDNSLDAGATRIDVALDGGGVELVRVVDNGSGMGPLDLERCVLPHATSKITTDDDLLHVRTLGFRGEALSSVAAVSRLTITSSPRDAEPHRLRVEAGRVLETGPAPGAPGTSVEVADLFFNVPARRRFLKRASSEYTITRSVFLDKALPFPEVEFRLSSGGTMKHVLPAGNAVSRITAAYPERTEPARLHEISLSGDGFRGLLIAGEPGAHRKDRKGLQVFVNRRRVWEYALVQAVEYAYRDYLHGGLYPVAYLFLDVEPELVDFNIHPAKREVRFRNLPEIHRRVVSALSGWLRIFDRKATADGAPLPFSAGELGPEHPGNEGGRFVAERRDYHPGADGTRHGKAIPTAARSGSVQRGQAHQPSWDLSRVYEPGVAGRGSESPDVPSPGYAGSGYRYLGQVMELFLVVERADRLYLVDQHAAHERIIYDRLRHGSSGQELLFPIRLEVDDDARPIVRDKRSDLSRLGIELDERDGAWELTTVPASIQIEAESLASLLMDLLERPSDFERELYASLSCRSAVMDGDRLADETAHMIISGVMGLENARCPHGRPIWVEWSREQLVSMVGRT